MSKAFVPGYKHDVFVSYAHVDDIPPHGVSHGWVTTFVAELGRQLAMLLGRKDNHSVWMDYHLRGNSTISPTILQEAAESATLLVILSQGYLSSEWCSYERETFLSRIKAQQGIDIPVFVIEKQRLDRSLWPRDLDNLRGYPFWECDSLLGSGTSCYTLADPYPREDQPNYWLRLSDLSKDLTAALRQILLGKGSEERPAANRVKVFLAEVTDDLEEKREEVKRYLDQRGLQVLPEYYYPNDPERFRRAQENDLADCRLFVQLLSSVAGKRPPGADNGFPDFQYQIAKQGNLPIIQWRSPDLDLEGDIVDAQRVLLEAETVMAVPIEEFKEKVIGRATTRVPETPISSQSTLVFVNHGDEDAELATKVIRIIEEANLGYSVPLREGSPAQLRQDLEENLLISDAILWIYGQAPLGWVREQLLNFQKVGWRRDKPARKALCKYPPTKPDPGIKLASMDTLDCNGDLRDSELRKLLKSLCTTGAP
jgi:hypothetical protein